MEGHQNSNIWGKIQWKSGRMWFEENGQTNGNWARERESEVMHKDTYVDDCISGDDDFEKVRVVTDDLKVVLNRGGFVLKCITESGSDHPDEDGESILVGGLRWFSKKDYLKLNIGDFNFSKKLRGRKARSDLGVVPEKLTRRDCVSKVSEIFDPLGRVAPIIGSMTRVFQTGNLVCAAF